MITRRRDPVATLHHNLDGSHHSNGTHETRLFRRQQLIALSGRTHHSRTVRLGEGP